MAAPSAKKSTIVRSIYSLTFRSVDRLAPRLAARWAERLWFTLPTHRGGPPARTAAASDVPDLLGTAFEVTLRAGGRDRAVRGWTWGDGPVVYLVHGWAGSAEQLAPLVRPLLERGLQVVGFDGLSHGRSDAGAHGPESSDAVELGRSLDAVAARFGPARAVVAHSMGALSTVLALRDGWVSAERLVLVAPVDGVPEFVRRFRDQLRFGPRTERHLAVRAHRRTGYAVADLDVAALGGQLDPRPQLLVVHDLNDRETAHSASKGLVAAWPGAELYTTTGLGHNRVLSDAAVGGAIARFAHREPVEPSLHGGEQPQPLPAIAREATHGVLEDGAHAGSRVA